MSQCWLGTQQSPSPDTPRSGRLTADSGARQPHISMAYGSRPAQSCPAPGRVTGRGEGARDACQDPEGVHDRRWAPRGRRGGGGSAGFTRTQAGARTGMRSCRWGSLRASRLLPPAWRSSTLGTPLFAEERMLKGWGNTDLSLLPRGKGSPGSPTVPVPVPPGAPLRPLGKGGEEAGRALLPVPTTAWLFSLCVLLLYKSRQETDGSGGRQLGQGGSPAPAGHRPHGPGTLQFAAQGWAPTTKNGSSERGARANYPAETCLPRRQLQPAITPTELFRSGDGHPSAHLGTLPGAQAPCTPTRGARCSHATFARPRVRGATCLPSCPRGPREPRFRLSPLPRP